MWYFRPGVKKNSIRNTGIKRTTREHTFSHARLALGWQFTRALDWPALYIPGYVVYCTFNLQDKKKENETLLITIGLVSEIAFKLA